MRWPAICIDTKVRLFNITCVTVLLWSLLLDTVSEHGKQDQCFRHILLQDHARYQTPWLCEKCTNLWDDKHQASHQHCKGTPTALSRTHPRMPEDRPCRRYALYVPTHGRRRPGRQRTSYMSYNQKLLGDTENDLHEEAIVSLASDRFIWRNFVVACSAAEW